MDFFFLRIRVALCLPELSVGPLSLHSLSFFFYFSPTLVEQRKRGRRKKKRNGSTHAHCKRFLCFVLLLYVFVEVYWGKDTADSNTSRPRNDKKKEKYEEKKEKKRGKKWREEKNFHIHLLFFFLSLFCMVHVDTANRSRIYLFINLSIDIDRYFPTHRMNKSGVPSNWLFFFFFCFACWFRLFLGRLFCYDGCIQY